MVIKKEVPPKKEYPDITEAHETYKGDAWKATKHLPYEYEFIESNWLEKNLPLMYNGIPLNLHYSRYTSKQMYQLFEIAHKYNRNLTEIHMNLPFMDKSTIKKYLREYKLIPSEKQRGVKIGERLYDTEIPIERVHLIIKTLKNYRGNIAKTSRRLHCSRYIVKKIGLEEGILKTKKTLSLETRAQSI